MSKSLVASVFLAAGVAATYTPIPRVTSLNEVAWTPARDCAPGAAFLNTAFGKIACEAAAQKAPDSIQGQCLPRVHKPPSGTPVTGAVLIYHGYTACPDQVMWLADRLASEGLVVYSPLTTGHGYEFEAQCNAPGRNCVNGDNNAHMPTSGAQYDAFVTTTYEAFKKDVADLHLPSDAHVGVFGLSVGASLATRSLILDAETGNKIFTNGVIGSPWLGLTAPEIQGAQIYPENPHGWGNFCHVNQRNNGRGGQCYFRLKNLGAANEFAESFVDTKVSLIEAPIFDAVLVSADGAWRNGKAAKVIRDAGHIGSDAEQRRREFDAEWEMTFDELKSELEPPVTPSVGMCIFPGGAVPHSNLGRSEYIFNGNSDAMWWEQTLHDLLVDSLLRDEHVGIDFVPGQEPDVGQCYAVPPQSPPADLFEKMW